VLLLCLVLLLLFPDILEETGNGQGLPDGEIQ